MVAYDHICKNCNEEFELEYSIHAPVPTVCVLCNFDGKVERLISYATPGKVEISASDMKSYIKSEARKIQKEALGNENKLENLVGPRYQTNTVQLERDMNNRYSKGKIRRD